jgi:hypothetical protein
VHTASETEKKRSQKGKLLRHEANLQTAGSLSQQNSINHINHIQDVKLQSQLANFSRKQQQTKNPVAVIAQRKPSVNRSDLTEQIRTVSS